MKLNYKPTRSTYKRFRVFLSLILLSVIHLGISKAQFTKLHDFRVHNYIEDQLITDGEYFYGTSGLGGTYDKGCVYKVYKDGTGYQVLYSFDGKDNGGQPNIKLTLNGNTLYGVTTIGGPYSSGTIFKINTDGTGYQKMYDFINTNVPRGPLTLSGSVLYGVTYSQFNRWSYIFKINTDGTGYQNIFDFGQTNVYSPNNNLILIGSKLYGNTSSGGANGIGNIYSVNIDGTGYQSIYDFDEKGSGEGTLLKMSNNVLYSISYYGGENGNGTIFKINLDGTGYQKLLDFNSTNGSNPNTFIVKDSVIYGTTGSGGVDFNGTVYKIKIDGTDYQNLCDFVNKNGHYPQGNLMLIDSALYGNATGGSYNGGLIYKIKTDGSGFQDVYNFTNDSSGISSSTCSLITSGNNVFGMTMYGGKYNNGVIYTVDNNGNNYRPVYSFDRDNGVGPTGYLVPVGSDLYGATGYGGKNNAGVIFKIKPDGSEYQRIFDFKDSLGVCPTGTVLIVDSVIYGMTSYGGINKFGVIYKMNIDGSGYQKLLDFNNINGQYPNSSLLLYGDTLFGITGMGGIYNSGLIFRINIDGSNYQKLLDYTVNQGIGNNPNTSLLILNSELYGITGNDGSNYLGTIYKLKTDGSNYKVLYNFNYENGATPLGHMVLSGTTLYGMTVNGGTNYNGVIYSYDIKTQYYQKLFDFNNNNNTGRAPLGSLTISGTTLFGTTSIGGFYDGGTIFKFQLPRPTVPASNVSISPILNNQANITWKRGSGNSCAVFMKQAKDGIVYPKDSVTYTASTLFGSGSEVNSSGWFCVYNGKDSSVNVSGLDSTLHYRIMVYEYIGSNGVELYSDTVVSTNPVTSKATQVISFPTLSDKVFSSVDFDPGASLNSGLKASYETSDSTIAIVKDGKIHIVGVGSVEIIAYQSGNDLYYPAPSITQSLTIKKASQSINFGSIGTKKYGDPDFTPGAASTSGLQIVYTSDNEDVATVKSNNIHIVGAGNVTIVASQPGNDNYDSAVSVHNQLIVDKAILLVTACDTSRKVGQTNPSFRLKYNGFVNLDNVTVLDNSPIAFCNAADTSSVGKYDIVVSGGVDKNYDFSYYNGVLTIYGGDKVNETENYSDLIVYPNPVKRDINIKGLNKLPVKVQIFNLHGEKVFESVLTKDNVDVSKLASGFYILKINTTLFKLLKE